MTWKIIFCFCAETDTVSAEKDTICAETENITENRKTLYHKNNVICVEITDEGMTSIYNKHHKKKPLFWTTDGNTTE
jgi:hypothetical protein